MRIVADNAFYARLALFLALVVIGAGAYFILLRGAVEAPSLPKPITSSPVEQTTSSSLLPAPSAAPAPAPRQQAQKKCAITGCNRHICADAVAPSGMLTTCEFKPEYGCYKTATCAVQTDGACGWTQTPALKACLADARCGAPPDQPSPPPGCEYEGAPQCADGQWTTPHLTCRTPQ